MAPAVVQKELLASAAVSGAATWLSVVKAITLELLGVPLPVVLAAATASIFAGSFQPPTTYGRALAGVIAWTLIGVFLSNLALILLANYLGREIPPGAMSGVALIVSGGGQMLCPLLWPVAREKLPIIFGKVIDKFGGFVK